MTPADPGRNAREPLYAWRALQEPPPEPVAITVLGATGSIGRQTLELVGRFPGRFHVVALSARSRWRDLAARAEELIASGAADPQGPWLAVAEPQARAELGASWHRPARLLAAGGEGQVEAASLAEASCVVNGLVGAVGLAPSLAALSRGARLALANKESLVVGGELVAEAACRGGGTVVPVDSEHSAIAQCLAGRQPQEMESVVLTASGGPFRDRPAAALGSVTTAEVLHHPTWRMGPKVTVDSATLMNKGLEVIEAHHLFGLDYAAIEVVIHPGSYVHSLVCFRDGSLLAQLGAPDMRVPILYALTGERRWPLAVERLNLARIASLSFSEPDLERFPCLRLAREAGQAGGTAPIVLNAANEVAVAALLGERIRFVDVPVVIEKTLGAMPVRPVEDLTAALASDAEARRVAAVALP
jgi:1-deoxy-D-xylulose-5-phosphate reductoisomerase